ncbi:MAG: hypothetical protein HY774_24595 [Acidobacteria bacterium]|nr:hypothetical protein [Acidobacteriota bacterium]
MTDTPPEIQKILDERFQALTPTERVIMASQMFDSARQIILSSFPPDLSEIEVKRRLCERLYGDEVDVDAFINYYLERKSIVKDI